MAFTIDDLNRIARETIGDRRLILTEAMSAVDAPGWDSLNHTIITLAIGETFGVDLKPRRLGEAKTFGELIAIVNQTIDAG